MPAGRPTDYTVEHATKLEKYIEDCVKNNDIPFKEEYCHKVGITVDNFTDWVRNTEFSQASKKLEDRQRFMLQKQSLLGKYNAPSAIFQLKANHGMIETEKRIFAGAPNEPIEFANLDDKQLDQFIKSKLSEVGTGESTGGETTTN